MKYGIINVGVNTSHGSLKSPIFEDNTFEFVPIPEKKCLDYYKIPKYKELHFRYKNYSKFIPKNKFEVRAHNDPEFHTFTYGDYPTKSPRAANLKRIEPGDILVFLARLVLWGGGRYLGPPGFFLVGYFEIKQIFVAIDGHRPGYYEVSI